MTGVSRTALAVGIGSIMLAAPVANAALTLTFDDGINAPVVVVDGGIGDPDSTEENFIIVSTTIGTFTLNGTVSTSTSPVSAAGILNLTNLSVTGDGTLTITAEDDSFAALTATQPTLLMATQTNSTDETVTYTAGFNGTQELAINDLVGNAVAEDTEIVDLSSPFTAFLQAAITRDSGDDQTQFNASLSVVPLPASGLLLLGGLGALGWVGRRRSKAAAA